MSTTPQATPQDAETPRRSKQSSRSTIEERKRATRACDQCRRLKEKCEGGNPCRRCTHSRRVCEFKSIASQGHDVRSHPRNSRAANGNSRELQERLMYMERILKHKFEGISLDTNSLCRMAESITGDGSTAHQSEDEYTEEADDFAIEEEVCTIDPIEDTTTHYSGEFSYWNFSMRIKRHIDDRMTTSNSPAPPVSDQVPVYWRAGQLNSGSNSLTAAISCCPPRHIAGFLVDIFFKYAERHCFYVDKNWLLERLDMLYNNPGNFSTKSASTISIILTVLAIGTQHAYLDSPKQNTSGNSGPVFSEDEVGTMFYQQAIRLLPEIIESSSLESVQACLLFGVYALPIDASGLGYIYINLAVRLAMQNGMHRKYAGEALSPAMIETRNRVWWTTYTLERKISIFHGRPLSTHRSDVDSDLPKEQGDLQDDNAVSNVSHMLASIHLTQRLEDCFNKISLLRNCRKQELPTILSDLIAMKRALETWWSTLSNELLDDKAKPQTQFRAIMHLRLEYSLIRMFIGRPFLFHRASSSQSDYNSPERHENTSPTDVPQGRTAPTSNNQKPGSSRAELVDDCIHAAEEALGICRSLQDSGSGLARASYIEYSSCRASLLVLIAYSIQNQSDQFRQPLKDGLDMIRDMSAAGDSARSEVLLIEALRRALIRLHSFGAKNSRDDESSPATRSLTSGYDSFKHWESMWKSGAAVSTLNSSRLMNNQTAASTSFLPRSRASDQNSQNWSMEGLGQMGDSSFGDPNGNNGRSFQSSAELALFGEGTMPSSSGWLGLPETQVLEEFLAIPQYIFDSGSGVGNTFGNMGSAPP